MKTLIATLLLTTTCISFSSKASAQEVEAKQLEIQMQKQKELERFQAKVKYNQALFQIQQTCTQGNAVEFKIAQRSLGTLMDSVSNLMGYAKTSDEVHHLNDYIQNLAFISIKMGPWGNDGWQNQFQLVCGSVKK